MIKTTSARLGAEKNIKSRLFDLPCTVIDGSKTLDEVDPFFVEFDAILVTNNNVWNTQSERAVLEFYDTNLAAF